MTDLSPKGDRWALELAAAASHMSRALDTYRAAIERRQRAARAADAAGMERQEIARILGVDKARVTRILGAGS